MFVPGYVLLSLRKWGGSNVVHDVQSCTTQLNGLIEIDMYKYIIRHDNTDTTIEIMRESATYNFKL